jgi:hypothetical protein
MKSAITNKILSAINWEPVGHLRTTRNVFRISAQFSQQYIFPLKSFFQNMIPVRFSRHTDLQNGLSPLSCRAPQYHNILLVRTAMWSGSRRFYICSRIHCLFTSVCDLVPVASTYVLACIASSHRYVIWFPSLQHMFSHALLVHIGMWSGSRRFYICSRIHC